MNYMRISGVCCEG